MPASFRLATFNVESLGDGPGLPPLAERIAVLRPQVLRLRADIVCLQEVNGQRVGPQRRRTLRALDGLLAGTPYAEYQRVTTVGGPAGASPAAAAAHGPRDRHNLVVLSRFPVAAHRQIHHHLIAPPTYRSATAEPAAEAAAVEWDRPFLYAAIALDGGRVLNLVNVHLRAPRAAFVAGQKADAGTWRTMPGWAEGFFLAAVKRAGQALEARLFIDRLLDADADALIAVVGDFNADDHEVPVRIVEGDEEDAGNAGLARRVLVAVERSLAESQRFSVVHHGRRQMVDHVLVSQSLLAWYRGVEIHNEALGDELVKPAAVHAAPESYHAPVVAEFASPEGGAAAGGGRRR